MIHAAGNNSRRSRVVCRSNLGRSAKANPNPAYPESNFESFERAVPRATESRKKSQLRTRKDESKKGRERRSRNPWLFRRAPITRDEEELAKIRKLSLVRGILAISACIACSSWFRSRKLAREKRGKREKSREISDSDKTIKSPQKEKLSATSA